LNIATNGGLTIVAVVRFTGDPGTFERIIDLSNGADTNNLLLCRADRRSGFFVAFQTSPYGTWMWRPVETEFTNTIQQNTWVTVVVRYSASTRQYVVTINNAADYTGTASGTVPDRTVSATCIGKSPWRDNAYFNGDIAGVFVVDEYLSAEATSALADAMVRGVDLTTQVCGDGITTTSEACDDGNSAARDGCSALCSVECGYTCSEAQPNVCRTTCGDAKLAGLEECDDGNTISGDGCSAVCSVEAGWSCPSLACGRSSCTQACGNGIKTASEACDDGNTAASDGCSAVCSVECGYACTVANPNVCRTTCGDSKLAGLEQCDDGNTISGDGCSADCNSVEAGWSCPPLACGRSSCWQVCGNGIKASFEACDDGNTADSDGCSAVCSVECGYTCTETQPNVCRTTCGDSKLAGLEQCDDGNTLSGDGCSADCNSVEAGWSCPPLVCGRSSCTQVCGNGIKTASEACDDGNTAASDGCSAVCSVEYGYTCAGQRSLCFASAASNVSVQPAEGDDFVTGIAQDVLASIICSVLVGTAAIIGAYFNSNRIYEKCANLLRCLGWLREPG
jgi:cysteine-rich repeat protein